MIKKVILITIVLCLLFTVSSLLVYTAAAQGQGQINVSNSTVKADYPNSLTFSCQAQGNSNITDIRLDYQVTQMDFGPVIAEAKVDFNSSTSVNASYTLNMQQYGQIPQGTDIDYWWVVKDSTGDSRQTQPAHYTVVDNKHTWNNLTQGKLNLFWYGQGQSFGQTIMSEAQSALTTLAQDTGATPAQNVNISVYTSDQDYTASVFGVPEWSGGVELSQYNAIMVIVSPSSLSSDLSGVAHELTHVIVGQITFNPYNSIPFWLNEGLAMHIQFPQQTLPSVFADALSSAFNNNSLITIRSLSDPFSANPSLAYLSYAESVSTVTYLINQYGSAKMNQLLNIFKQGSSYDSALQAVYGFNMDGLFSQWKTWVTQSNGKYPVY